MYPSCRHSARRVDNDELLCLDYLWLCVAQVHSFSGVPLHNIVWTYFFQVFMQDQSGKE